MPFFYDALLKTPEPTRLLRNIQRLEAEVYQGQPIIDFNPTPPSVPPTTPTAAAEVHLERCRAQLLVLVQSYQEKFPVLREPLEQYKIHGVQKVHLTLTSVELQKIILLSTKQLLEEYYEVLCENHEKADTATIKNYTFNVCFPGISSNLQFMLKLFKDQDLQSYIAQAKINFLEQHALEFYKNLIIPDNPQNQNLIGNEIHIVNGLFNALAADYGLNLRKDVHVNVELTSAYYDRFQDFINSKLNLHKIVDNIIAQVPLYTPGTPQTSYNGLAVEDFFRQFDNRAHHVSEYAVLYEYNEDEMVFKLKENPEDNYRLYLMCLLEKKNYITDPHFIIQGRSFIATKHEYFEKIKTNTDSGEEDVEISHRMLDENDLKFIEKNVNAFLENTAPIFKKGIDHITLPLDIAASPLTFPLFSKIPTEKLSTSTIIHTDLGTCILFRPLPEALQNNLIHIFYALNYKTKQTLQEQIDNVCISKNIVFFQGILDYNSPTPEFLTILEKNLVRLIQENNLAFFKIVLKTFISAAATRKKNNCLTQLLNLSLEKTTPEFLDVLFSEKTELADHPQLKTIDLLFSAIKKKQTALIKYILEKNNTIDINAIKDNTTALMLAAETKNLEVVKLLVEKGANLNTVVENNNALSISIEKKDIATFEYLIEKEVELSVIKKTIITPILFALAYHISPEVIKKILEKKPSDIYVATIMPEKKYSPLDLAISVYKNNPQDIEKKLSVIKLLIEKDLGKKIKTKFTLPIHLITKFNLPLQSLDKIIELLLQKDHSPFGYHPEGKTSLHDAVEHNTAILIHLLGLKKIDINALDQNKETPLILACKQNNLPAIKALVEAGANITLCNEKGHNALHFAILSAVENEDFQAVHYLIEQGKALNTTEGKTKALHAAVLNRNPEAFKYILSNIDNFEAFTPEYRAQLLELCIQSINPSINSEYTFTNELPVNNELQKNVIYVIKDDQEHTRYTLSTKTDKGNFKRSVHVCDLFKKNVDDLTNQDAQSNILHLIFPEDCAKKEAKTVSIVEYLLEKNIDINRKTSENAKPLLHIAIEQKSIPLMTLLFEKKVDIEAKNSLGETALMFALHKPNIKVIELILKNKPNLQCVNNAGQNLLFYVNFHCTLQNLLSDEEKNTIDVNHVSNEGTTPLIDSIINRKSFFFHILKHKNINLEYTYNGKTALLHTVEKNPDLTNIFIEEGADKKALTPEQLSAVMLLARGPTHILSKNQKLFGSNDFEQKDGEGKNILWHLLYSVHNAEYKALNNKAKATKIKNFIDIIHILKQYKIDLDWNLNVNGETPLLYALKHNAPWEAIEALIKNGAQLNTVIDYINPTNGQNIIWNIIENYDKKKDLANLLDKGFNLNHQDNTGMTPLMYAITCHNTAAISTLAAAPNIDLTLKNNEGLTVQDMLRKTEFARHRKLISTQEKGKGKHKAPVKNTPEFSSEEARHPLKKRATGTLLFSQPAPSQENTAPSQQNNKRRRPSGSGSDAD